MSTAPKSNVFSSPIEGEALSLLQDKLLPGFLTGRRWYAAKDAGTPTVRIVDALPLPLASGSAQLCLLRVEAPGREAQLYQLPLVLNRDGQGDDGEADTADPFTIAGPDALPWPGSLRDGYGDEEVVRALLNGIRKGGENGGLRYGRSRAFDTVKGALDGGAPLRWTGVEQSNTSVRVGDAAILKGLRKLESGTHPELEVGRFLTEVANFRNTPALLGWVERTGDGEAATLCILQELVPEARDAWSHVTAELAKRVERFNDDTADDVALMTFMRRLGRRTAEMHRALATPGGGDAFTPEPVTPAMLKGWADGVRSLARRVLGQLREAAPRLDADLAPYAASLADSEATVMRQIETLTPPRGSFHAMRLHGDYHLGQVLAGKDDLFIVDFEGEPMRPLAERRAKHCILRDVAGMLRSITYAAAGARAALPDTLDETARGARTAWLNWWEGEAASAFVAGYREAIGDCPGWPADAATATQLLKLFLLEKALYEIGYELANRPDWLAIPLAGAIGILGADAGPEVADRASGPVGLAAPGATRLGEARAHAMPFGAQVQPDGSVRFTLWAPGTEQVSLWIEDTQALLPMVRRADGWFEWTTAQAQAGTRYQFELPDGLRVPDPASRHQPEDVHGPSEVIDPTVFRWSDAAWTGRPWHETVLYELHVGTFTEEGTFRAAIDKLDHLVELGVTAIELLPVADFPGARNWGYDGVLPYAPDAAYGRPEDLKALVDAAHAKGLMVFLDVVYNHFGPDGNYLHAYAKAFFTDRHKTPWGDAINVDGPRNATVRDYFIHNALYWIEEFHMDGLRFDAVHAILDDSDKLFLQELAERVQDAVRCRRHVHLVLENDENEAHLLERHPEGDPRWHTAQWNDDLHHCLHVWASGEDAGYYADYAGDAVKLARAMAEGFAFQGHASSYRGGEARGEPSAHLPPTAFVTFIQNHDQIGNRAFGDRITRFSRPEAVRAASSLYLLGPGIPMLFMGEEWASDRPFPFFCDFADELAEAVRNGRREEFAKFPEFQDPKVRDRIPDPTAPETFQSAKLDWDDRETGEHGEWLGWYRRILAVRRKEIAPRLENAPGGAAAHEVIDGRGIRVSWRLGDGSRLHLLANLADAPVTGMGEAVGRVLWTEGKGLDGGTMAPLSVLWTIEETTALDRLGERMGIETHYTGASGETIQASEGTIRALLAAMEVDADDPEEALAALERRELARPLPPVAVLRIDRPPFSVTVTLPEGSGTLRWTLTLEGGGDRSGEADFGDLPLVRKAGVGGQHFEVRRLDLGAAPAPGYHQLRLDVDGLRAEHPGLEMTVIAAPATCHLPAPLQMGERIWGLSVQLYALRCAGDWGIGDFGDLVNVAEMAAARGAGIVGLNPLHALFLDQPDQASPYSPASRLFLNPLYIDVLAVPELMGCAETRDRIADESFLGAVQAAGTAPLVDYAAVAALKLPVLERLFAHFQSEGSAERRRALAAFRAELGEGLERFCTFQALRERFAKDGTPDWRRWPEEYRDATSPAVRRFAEERRERIDFFIWLQWLADSQLQAAAERARERGMAVGFFRDLAVGADSGGAETWADPHVVVAQAHVGAPPDLFNPAGQDWGLPPFHPHALREGGYARFIELLRANMRHAGALRIDHAMALQHVYWIPEGHPPSEGAYVAYPMDDLLGILALESQRNRCLVVGEDLGTVPEGFRERMAEAGVLSYRVMFFEWTEDGGFRGPDDYPYAALATVGSHDLATLRGWWEGHDITLKEERGLYPAEGEAERQRDRRMAERARLLEALADAFLPLPASFGPDSPYSEALGHAVHAFLARTGSAIAMVQMDDLTAELEQVNLPGTVDQYPNWRRKLRLALEDMADCPQAGAIAAIMAAARPAAVADGKKPESPLSPLGRGLG
ncbi:malto-oligosyltrehalose trehalohydrolase [Azospirillum argentinense]|uniref:4-alpha-glucanotransferase n=1 Tax=Azospirillum argentinense TaxID=2970906 RepID=A0ABW8V6W9_9PROT